MSDAEELRNKKVIDVDILKGKEISRAKCSYENYAKIIGKISKSVSWGLNELGLGRGYPYIELSQSGYTSWDAACAFVATKVIEEVWGIEAKPPSEELIKIFKETEDKVYVHNGDER